MDNDTTGSVFGAWEALRQHLEARTGELNAEVAHYPTPIARCDVQLSKLLEQRARLYRELDGAASIGGLPPAGDAVGYWLDRFAKKACNELSGGSATARARKTRMPRRCGGLPPPRPRMI
jgi:hypothetical protein